jgi:hypothetical protein
MGQNAWAEAKWIVNQLEGNSGGGGIAPDNCISVLASKDKDLAMKLYYTWPEDTTIEGQTLVSVAGCKAVLYEGEDLADETKGILLSTSTIKNEYKTSPLLISSDYFEEGHTYTIHVFPYSDQGVVNRNKKNSVTFTSQQYILYGCKVNKNDSNPATRVSYLEDCDNANYTAAAMNYTAGTFNYGTWAEAWFIKQCKPCMLKYDGTVDYYLNPDDYTKKEDGTASDIANTAYEGNAMVEMPLVWIKTLTEGTEQYYYYSDIQIDSDYHAYPFYNSQGDLMQHTYLPIYNGTAIATGGVTRLRSISGQSIMNNVAGTTEITYATNNNPSDIDSPIWHTEVLADRLFINALLLLIGKSTDGQTTFGNGHYTGGSSASNLLKSGTMNTRGLFWGTNGTGNGVKVFGIENWWGNQWRRITGYINASGTQKIKLTYDKTDGSTVNGYNTTGDGYITLANMTPSGTSGGHISDSVVNEYGWFPKTASGSQTTYECDGLWFNNSQTDYAIVGGTCHNGFLDGPWCVYLKSAVSSAAWDFGATVSCKPLL